MPASAQKAHYFLPFFAQIKNDKNIAQFTKQRQFSPVAALQNPQIMLYLKPSMIFFVIVL
jgi:hypothetical protein